jgi:uncharacterized protein
MTTREESPLGAPCWLDVMSSDIDRTRAFYGELFGWESEAAGEEFGGYVTFTKDGVSVAGGMANNPESGMPDLWTTYLCVADVQATCEAAGANGGGVMLAPMDIGDPGSMAVVTDPGGAAIGLWQPKEHKGFGAFEIPGAPSWFELHTRDYDACLAFYAAVFGWDFFAVGDTPDFRYSVPQGEGQIAGVMDATDFLPDHAPAHWSVYFEVEDLNAALAQVGDLGGSTLVPGEDTPYGRLATAIDPTGALFKLRTSPVETDDEPAAG